jgi:hypothetical protein
MATFEPELREPVATVLPWSTTFHDAPGKTSGALTCHTIAWSFSMYVRYEKSDGYGAIRVGATWTKSGVSIVVDPTVIVTWCSPDVNPSGMLKVKMPTEFEIVPWTMVVDPSRTSE